MRAGNLDRSITIQAVTVTTIDDNGTPVTAWDDFANVRAQSIQAGADEYLRGYGEGDNLATIFRIRWLDGLTPAHRVIYDGTILNIREIKEIGRRRGLELRCEEVRS